MPSPLITVAVPSLDQGRYLREALDSIFAQELDVEVFVADGGSTDDSVDVIRAFESRLAGWRSHRDAGQAAAVNECIARGTAPYVCWLNSDDALLPGAFNALVEALERDPGAPAAYGRAWKLIGGPDAKAASHAMNSGPESQPQADPRDALRIEVQVQPFDFIGLSRRCIVSQPATLIRRNAWEAVDGLDERLHFAMDYDLWWRLYRAAGPLRFVDRFVAIDREHSATKSVNNSFEHFREAVEVVRRHRGYEPMWTRVMPVSLRWRLARLKQRVRNARQRNAASGGDGRGNHF